MSQAIYNAAAAYIGTKEIPGPASNPQIKQWIAQAADWLDKDDSKTAWCGCFRGAMGLATGTGVPVAHYRAASWAKWGKAVIPAHAQLGDTVVTTRKGGHHVGILHKITADYVWLLGGNQSDAVTIARFPASSILAIRRG